MEPLFYNRNAAVSSLRFCLDLPDRNVSSTGRPVCGSDISPPGSSLTCGKVRATASAPTASGTGTASHRIVKHSSYCRRPARERPSSPAGYIGILAKVRRQLLFVSHAQRFYIHQAIDIPAVRSLKLQVLILLVNKDNIRTILPELMVSNPRLRV